MEYHWLRKEGNRRLMVFVLGWASDHRIVEHTEAPGCDILAVFDYRDLRQPDQEAMERIDSYPEKYLLAWSFGVWAAEQLFPLVDFTRAVAFNGTPHPVHDKYGIEPRRLDITIRGLASGGMELFERRAYGDMYENLSHLLSPRGLDANIEELSNLRFLAAETYVPSMRWDKAIVGTADLIFNPGNMLAYWGNRATSLPLPHYPFGDAGIIENEIGIR